MIRRYARVLVLIGGIAAGGVVAVVVSTAALPATAAPQAAASGTLSTALTSNRIAATTPSTSTVPGGDAWGFRGGRGDHGGFGGGGDFGIGRGGFGGRGLTVTAVNGNTITATGRGSQTLTVQVSATTAYTEADASASLSDVKVGSTIAVRGSFANTNGTTITATGITIVLPQVGGVVTNVNGSTLTLTQFDGSTRSVTVGGGTRYQKAGASAALSDISAGIAVQVEGTLNSDGSLSAVRVTIQVPRIAGQVTAVNGTSYTVSGRFGGSSYTVNATSSTTYVNADGSAATAATVKANTFIMAEGTLSSDGKTLTALRILVGPAAGANGDFGPQGGFGRHGGRGGFDGGFGGGFGGAQGTTPSTTVPGTTGATGTQSI